MPDQNWRLGNYEILEEIGRGGMGVIYRARQRHSRRIVAVKRVLSYHSDSRETLARFRREAQAAASLDHPEHSADLRSERKRGRPPVLQHEIRARRQLAGGRLRACGTTRANASRSSPKSRAPSNTRTAKASSIATSNQETSSSTPAANRSSAISASPNGSTPPATSPAPSPSSAPPATSPPNKPAHSAAELKPTADVYSLGAILFDLLAGRPPFLGAHALSVIRQAAESPAPKLRTLSKVADRDLETICARCLEREPKLRYPSAHDLAEDLERWLEGRPIIARPISPIIGVWRWSKRNPVLSVSGCGDTAYGGSPSRTRVRAW